jgi:hypothetical protein
MKKLFRPIIKAATSYYEGTTLTKVPRSRSRKTRKYANVDISKEFEKRGESYKQMQQNLIENIYEAHGHLLKGPDGKINKDLINPNSSIDIIEIGDTKDLKSKYLISGVKKLSILGVIKYHQLNHNLFADSKLHPETQKQLERLHYLVEHNLPIEKEMLFTLVPELFLYEINKLEDEDKKLFEYARGGYLRADGTVYEIDTLQNYSEFILDEDLNKDRVKNMELYVLHQSKDLFDLYKDKITDFMLRNKYTDFNDYMNQLLIMDEDKMMDWEKNFIRETKELRAIYFDMQAYEK